MDDNSPIIFYYYFDLSDTECFCRELERRFRESGHTRKIEFRSWNCYNDEPGHDGDLFSYDSIVLSALKDKGYIRELPDVIDVSDVFGWVRDKLKVDRKLYSYPMMGCFDSVICHKSDYTPFHNLTELDGKIATHLKGQLFYFYLQYFCNLQGDDSRIIELLRKLRASMVSPDAYDDSNFSSGRVVRDFADGNAKYFIGFTEMLRFFPKDEYVVRHANFSDRETDSFPMFLVDGVSMGTNVSGEKLLDCLDIMEIISDPDFIYAICTPGGRLQYMLPVNRRVIDELMKLDPQIYSQLNEIADNDDNCILRFGKDFYERIGEFESGLQTLMDQMK